MIIKRKVIICLELQRGQVWKIKKRLKSYKKKAVVWGFNDNNKSKLITTK